jgi:hypothetical protein
MEIISRELEIYVKSMIHAKIIDPKFPSFVLTKEGEEFVHKMLIFSKIYYTYSESLRGEFCSLMSLALAKSPEHQVVKSYIFCDLYF